MATTSTAKVAPVHSTTYPLEFDRIFSYNPGFLAPVYSFLTLPGDSVGLSIRAAVDTLPVESPAYTRFRAQLRYFWTDLRAYIPALAQDIYSLNPESVELPVAPPPVFVGTANSGGESAPKPANSPAYIPYAFARDAAIAPSSLLNFIYYPAHSGLPYYAQAAGSGDLYIAHAYNKYKDFLPSMLPFLTYLHTYYRYYMNPQNPIYRSIVGTNKGTSILSDYEVAISDVSGDTLSRVLLNATTGKFYTDSSDNATSSVNFIQRAGSFTDWQSISDWPAFYANSFNQAFSGLAILPYLPSVNECWINGASVNRLTTATTLNSSSLTVGDILAKDKLRKYISLGIFGAANYREWVNAQFDVMPVKGFNSPQYMGGDEYLISFSDVIAQSAEGLGERGGKGGGSGKVGYRRYFFDSYGVFQVLFDCRPILNYSAGVDTQWLFSNLSELPSYEMSSIPWEPLRRGTLSGRIYPQAALINGSALVPVIYANVQSTSAAGSGQSGNLNNWNLYDDGVVGYRPAWTPYRSAYNRAIGLLAENEGLSTWTMNRSYFTIPDSYVPDGLSEGAGGFRAYTPYYDYTSYISPQLMNSLFVDQDIQAQNMIVYLKFNMDIRRRLSNDAVPTF